MNGFQRLARCIVKDIDSGEIIGYGDRLYTTVDGFTGVQLDDELTDHEWPNECIEYTEEEEGN